MGLVNAELNAIADFEAGRIGAIGLHTTDPGANGTTGEASGSGYARQPITWAAAGAVGPLGAGSQPATPGDAWSSEATFSVPSGQFTYASYWSAVGGTYRGSKALPAAQGNPSAPSTVKVSTSLPVTNVGG